MPENVIIPAEEGFINPPVPARRQFKPAKDVLKAAIIARNPGMATVNFEDLKVTVDHSNHTLTLAIRDNVNTVYNFNGDKSGSKVLSYNDIDFNAVLTTVLRFASVYLEESKNDVVATLPRGLSHTYEDATQRLTVTVDNTNTNVITFLDTDTTPCTVLFVGKQAHIDFVDPRVDVEDVITVTNLSLSLEDLLMPPAEHEPG